MKQYFPGDTDFSWERYPYLPYQYVLLAIQQGTKQYQSQLHDYERPIALNTTVIASQNRDPKKGKMPTYTEFSFYKPVEDGDRPDYVYGSAYMSLVKSKRLPHWALFCFKDLSSSANAGYEPAEAALIAEDAILLHPTRVGHNSYEGLLIAMESASEKRRDFTDDKGQVISLTLPYVGTKFIAEEDVILN